MVSHCFLTAALAALAVAGVDAKKKCTSKSRTLGASSTTIHSTPDAVTSDSASTTNLGSDASTTSSTVIISVSSSTVNSVSASGASTTTSTATSISSSTNASALTSSSSATPSTTTSSSPSKTSSTSSTPTTTPSSSTSAANTTSRTIIVNSTSTTPTITESSTTATTAASPQQSSSSPNWVVNPGFESGSDYWNLFNGANVQDSATTTTGITAYQGTKFLIAPMSEATRSLNWYQNAGGTTAGKKYTATVYWTVGSQRNFGSGSCSLTFVTNWVQSGDSVPIVGDTTSVWNKAEWTFVRSGGTQIGFIVHCDSTGVVDVGFDAVSLYEVGAQPATTVAP